MNEFARRSNLIFEPGKAEYVFAKHKTKQVLLAKPTTGMNRSGLAVKEF